MLDLWIQFNFRSKYHFRLLEAHCRLLDLCILCYVVSSIIELLILQKEEAAGTKRKLAIAGFNNPSDSDDVEEVTPSCFLSVY